MTREDATADLTSFGRCASDAGAEKNLILNNGTVSDILIFLFLPLLPANLFGVLGNFLIRFFGLNFLVFSLLMFRAYFDVTFAGLLTGNENKM